MTAYWVAFGVTVVVLVCVFAWALCRMAALSDADHEKAPREGRGAIPSAPGIRVPGDFDVPGRLAAGPAGGKQHE